jgi:hypothetical protein
MDGRTYEMVLNVTFPLIFLAIFSHTRLKKRHTSKNGMNRTKENLLLPIVLQVTQVPLGCTEGRMNNVKAITVLAKSFYNILLSPADGIRRGITIYYKKI